MKAIVRNRGSICTAVCQGCVEVRRVFAASDCISAADSELQPDQMSSNSDACRLNMKAFLLLLATGPRFLVSC